METEFVTSSDGHRIAYDVCGRGPGLILLHGAGKTRRDWHTAGYVDQLKSLFTVATVDIRGQGESGFLTNAQDFSIDLMTDDFLRVADACGLTRFHLCGYSFGGGIARYLSARSDRVISSVIIGAPFTNATDKEMVPFFEGLLKKWDPIVQGYKNGTLSQEEMARATVGRLPVWAACFEAMRDWPKIAPVDIRCPMLLLVGTKNVQTVSWINKNEECLDHTTVVVEYLDDLDHEAEFTQIEKSLRPILGFLCSQDHAL